MSVCDERDFLVRATPLHLSVPPEGDDLRARWGALYARFPPAAFQRRLGWLTAEARAADDRFRPRVGAEPVDWCFWLRDRSWLAGDHGAGALARWAVARLAAPSPDWPPSVGEALGRHLAGEIEGILALVGGPSPGPQATAAELVGLARRRPALARLIGTRVELWCSATAELRRRYEADRTELVAAVLDGRDPGPLVDVVPGLGDSHDGFRTVTALTFTAGQRVVYKPRSIEVEAAWSDLAGWIAVEAGGCRIRAHRVLPRNGYGWAEYIRPDDGSPSRPAATQVWYRTGWLLAVLYALGASDCHGENVVLAHGWPYLVDAETLITAPHRLESLVEAGRSEAGVAAARRLRHSVLGACVLPAWATLEGQALELGGFDLPVGGPGRDEFVAGFADGYRFLLARRRRLVAWNGPAPAPGVGGTPGAPPAHPGVRRRAASVLGGRWGFRRDAGPRLRDARRAAPRPG